ncbi:MAG: TetR/AcrR family transcriptional regulator [Cyanobacteria bacterium J06626_23]
MSSGKSTGRLDNPDKAKQILAGALEVFTTQGYAAASMTRIAAAAGVSKPTLYSYFDDKAGLFVALIQSLTLKSGRLLFESPKGPDLALPPDQVLRQMMTSILRESSQNQHFMTLMRLIIGESEQFPELAQTFVREVSKPMLEKLAQYLDAHPQLNFPDPMVTARVIAGAIVHYMITQDMMQGKEIMPMDCDRMVDGLIDLVMAAGQRS